jgi:hypothetical protein
MKERKGFVTNSSSSCFIVKVNEYTKEENKLDVEDVEYALRIMLKSYNSIFGTNLRYNSVFGYVGVPDEEKVKEAFSNAAWGTGEGCIKVYDEHLGMSIETTMTYLDLAKTGDFVIFSKEDNSIPYQLHGYIEDVLRAKKLHLG